MDRLKALTQLSAVLRGEIAPDVEWMDVIALANQALVTPHIHAAAVAKGVVQRLPEDVGRFTGEVLARNRVRNQRLFSQLHEAVAALNAAGIEPTVLKGAALWLTLGRPADFDRMLNDLDLLVQPAEAEPAVQSLAARGFGVMARYDGAAVHVVAELSRPTDVGAIDLHQRPPGPPGLAELTRQGRSLVWDGVRLRLPAPAAQVFLLVLHDQFHEGGYWRGAAALRHLLDIAVLAPGVDWTALERMARTPLAKTALGVELAAAEALAGAAVPPSLVRRPWVRLQRRRQLAQFAWPSMGMPLAALALVSEAPALIAHRRFDRAARRRLVGSAGRPLRERLDRVRELIGRANPGHV